MGSSRGQKSSQKVGEKVKKVPHNDSQLLESLFYMFLEARRGKTGTADEYRFEVNFMANLVQLEQDIIYRRYKPGRSKAFITHEPVTREIFAAPFRDRVTHHLLYTIVAPWWDKYFIYDSYSCRVGKGTDFGVFRLQRFLRKVSQNGTKKAYVFKGDLSGYFMSMKRELLYEKVLWGLKKQFPKGGWTFELCEYLWKEIIFDDPIDGVRIAGSLKEWEDLPRNKSLFHQPKGQGIVIGNLTSQLLSNIFMNDFDWYVKKKLGFSCYGRYVDDFFVVVPEEDLERLKKAIRSDFPDYLTAKGLTMHPNKIYLQEAHKGCPFLGKMVHINAVLPGERFKKNARKAFHEFAIGEGDLDSVMSYYGMIKNITAQKFMHDLFEEVGGRYYY